MKIFLLDECSCRQLFEREKKKTLKNVNSVESDFHSFPCNGESVSAGCENIATMVIHVMTVKIIPGEMIKRLKGHTL